MKKIVYRRYGPAEDVLELVSVTQPNPGPIDVLISAEAWGVNPIDVRLRSGELKFMLPGGFPRTPGFELSGVVISAGSQTGFSAGDRVVAYLSSLHGGAAAQTVCSPAKNVVKLPTAVSFINAAVTPLTGSTALQALRDLGSIRGGSRVLINGASGGVGLFALQIARHFGAITTAVAGQSYETLVKAHGASQFINYRTQDFCNLDQQWDIIFDVVGNRSFSIVKDRLSAGGNYISTEPNLRGFIDLIRTCLQQKKSKIVVVKSKLQDLKFLMSLIEQEILQPVIAESLPLYELAKAHRKMENESFAGKLVLVADEFRCESTD